MANGRNPRRKVDVGRDGGGFVALPWSVLDCPAFQALSHPARSLLLEVARQFARDNNGRLLLSRAYMVGRGWKSHDTLTLQAEQGKLVRHHLAGARPVPGLRRWCNRWFHPWCLPHWPVWRARQKRTP